MHILTSLRQQGQETANDQSVAISAEALDAYPLGKIFAQQGDIYLSKAPISSVAKGARAQSGQLAPGTTQGSRHCVDPAKVRISTPDALASPLQGPTLYAKESFTITHPEHGHITLPPGCYRVTYQRAYADEMRRVMD